MPHDTSHSWRCRLARGVRATLVLSCLFTGCHSVRFGAAVTTENYSETTSRPVLADLDTPIVRATAQEPIPEPLHVQRIDLETALRLAGAANPTIAIAEEALRARLAERMQARALLFPSLQVGANLRVHRGNFMTAGGTVVDRNIQSLYYGFGADAKGAGTVAVPGLRIVSHLADAYYAPQAAQERVLQSRFDADNTHNYILMEVGIRYLALVEADASRAAFEQSLKEVSEIERVTTSFAKAGQGRDSDARRAGAEAQLLRGDIERTREESAVAAAELARLLDVDPSDRFEPADPVPPILELVDKDLPLAALLEQALAQHPEIIARSAEVGVQEIGLKQERVRPFLPLIAVGFSAGEFGGGNDRTTPRFKDFAARTDLDVVAVWSLQNLGVGNRAVQNAARARVEIAHQERARTIERIRAEVGEAHALTLARSQEMAIARKRVEISQRAYTQDLTRTKNAQGRPIEVLASANQLAQARQDLVRAMVGYSQAQLRLHTALGNPAR